MLKNIYIYLHSIEVDQLKMLIKTKKTSVTFAYRLASSLWGHWVGNRYLLVFPKSIIGLTGKRREQSGNQQNGIIETEWPTVEIICFMHAIIFKTISPTCLNHIPSLFVWLPVHQLDNNVWSCVYKRMKKIIIKQSVCQMYVTKFEYSNIRRWQRTDQRRETHGMGAS